MPIERKLAAIMFTDIAGYTEQMSKDQDIAFSLLETKQNALLPLVKKHNGTLIKQMGDGTLSHFPSAVDASNCSVEFQKAIHEQNNLNVRIGIHLGDTMFKDNDVYGDGVNIASRLEIISPPGGVLISKNVYDELSSRKSFEGVSLGMQQLKNVGRLIEVFSLKADYLTVADPKDYSATKVDIHEDLEVPSVAIIPFINKGFEEDIFYAYGISADLISDLSEAGDIRVASLKDIDRLNTNLLTNDELAEKLMVRYIVSGMLWKSGEMFQLSIELFDSKHHRVLWSDRWQEKWDNLANIKSKLADGVLKTLNTAPDKKVSDDAINPEAYEYYLKGKYRHEKRKNLEDVEIARGFFQKALELEPGFILPEIELGLTYFFTGDYNKAGKIFSESLQKSETNNDKRAASLCLNQLGMLSRNQGNYNKAIDYHSKALAVREELGDKLGISMSLNNLGLVQFYQKKYVSALDYFNRSLVIKEKLDDHRRIAATLNNCALVYKSKGDYQLAFETMNKALNIYLDIGAQKETSDVYYNMGNNLINFQNDYENSMNHFKKSLDIKTKLGESKGISICLYTICEASFLKGVENVSISDLTKCLEIRRKIGSTDEILETLALYLIIQKGNGSNIKKDRSEIEKLMAKAKNISHITYFRLHKLFDDHPKLAAEYLNKARKLVLAEAENFPDKKVKQDFLNSTPNLEIFIASKEN